MSFTKLHQTILDSSIWQEPMHVRICWITMMAMADMDGLVAASIGGLAHRANITREQCQEALRVFLGPDPDSRDGTTGERIAEVAGGWLLLNHANYRDQQTREQRLAAIRVKRHREQRNEALQSVTERYVTPCNAAQRSVTPSSQTLPNSPSEAEAEAEQKPERAKPRPAAARPAVVSEPVWQDFLKQRRVPLTETALAGMVREATKAGWTLERAMVEATERGWKSFKAAWVDGRRPGAPPPTSTVTSGKRIYQEHPAAMPVPYETPIARCECGLCGKRRAQAVAS
jgi:hypothetical protein